MLQVADVSVRFGSVQALDGVSLQLREGSGVLALLGPSGCGKSTLLRAVAGLEPLDGGAIAFDGQDLTTVPVHQRGFGLVFQDGQLFPHRTVAGNIGYGVAKADRAGRVRELLDLIGLPGLGDRRVDQLSGGQAQRVALARALAPRPRLLLLDEPLSALDRELRDRLADDLARILRATGTPTIVVTHDHAEAAALGDVVAVMDSGRIVQRGTPRDLWRHPANASVARFLGYTASLPATVQHGVATCVLGAVVVDAPDGEVVLGLRPESLAVSSNGRVEAEVATVAALPNGNKLKVRVAGVGELAAVAALRDEVTVGQQVRLWLDPRTVAVVGLSAGSVLAPSRLV